MQPRDAIATDIVLLGAGAAHLEVLRRSALRPQRGLRLTLVAPQPETPSAGRLPALIRGDGAASDTSIDLAALAVAAGVRLILAEPVGLDLPERMLKLTSRPALPFDLLSVDLGGDSAMPDVRDACLPVNPLGRFLALLPVLENALADNARLAVIGDAPAAVELALALARRFRGRLRLVLVTETPEPLAAAPLMARRVVRAALVDAGVELASGVCAGRLTHGRLALSDGSFLAADVALWAGATLAPGFLAESGLACDAAGRVRVNAGQRSVSHPCVFAAGDCATQPNDRWAGPLLSANLCRAASGRRLIRSLRRSLLPQVAFAILDLGGGRAVAWSNGVALAGEAVWRWKDWLNRRGLAAYTPRVIPPRPDQSRPASPQPSSRHPSAGRARG